MIMSNIHHMLTSCIVFRMRVMEIRIGHRRTSSGISKCDGADRGEFPLGEDKIQGISRKLLRLETDPKIIPKIKPGQRDRASP